MKLKELLERINKAIAEDSSMLEATVITQTRYDRYEDTEGTLAGHQDGGFIIENFYKTPHEILEWIQKENGYEELKALEEYLATEDGQSYRKVFALTNWAD